MIVTEPFVKSWLDLQRKLIHGLQSAHVSLLGDDVSGGGLVFTFPEGLAHQAELALAAELACRSQAPVTGNAGAAGEGGPILRIAYPLQLGKGAEGAVVIEVDAPLHRQAKIIELLRWGETWLRLALRQAGGTLDQATFGAVVRAGLSQDDEDAARSAVLALLPDRVGCTRVGLGRLIDDRLVLLAVSDVPELDRRGSRAKLLLRAMRESLDAANPCEWPQHAFSDTPARAQRDLVESAGLNGVCSVPVIDGLRDPLVFVFEFAGAKRGNERSSVRCVEAASVVTPLLELSRMRDLSWIRRLGALLNEGIRRLAGPEGRLRRAVVAIALLALAVFAAGSGEYRVSAPAAVEGAVQRAVVAPFDGYIEHAAVRAGQKVARGDLLASLDDRDLRNELRSLVAQEQELTKQHRQAVALLDHGKTEVIEAQLAQAHASRTLIEDRLTRTALRAPLDGLVISGDWSRSLGVPVSRGELLFEISPLNAYRVSIKVPDREIAGLAAGQKGELILSALPRKPVEFSVTDIATLAIEEPGEPVFRVEAAVADGYTELRPGMEGVAKITVGERRRWWIWTHALTDWLRLQLWRWLP